jgi:hypothetical protein
MRIEWDSDPFGSRLEYICWRGHRISIPRETLDKLQAYLSDPTLGSISLDLLCSRCNAIGSCKLDPVGKIFLGNVPGFPDDMEAHWQKMRCGEEHCEVRRIVVAMMTKGTTEEAGIEAFASATIPSDFLCSEGHRIRWLSR